MNAETSHPRAGCASAQLVLPLIDPFEPRVMPQDHGAWFTIARRAGPGDWRENHHRLTNYEAVLRAIGAALDTYVTQGTFTHPDRRAVHLAWLTHALIDLDIYKAGWQDAYPDDVVREVTGYCDDQDIPRPSIIVSSGRGYYLKWFWSTPIPRAEAGRAIAVNRALRHGLAKYGADKQAVDVSRVLRVVGTFNSSSEHGKPVSIVWFNGSASAPATYDFDAFARNILPRSTDADPDTLGLGRSEMRWFHNRVYRFSLEGWYWGVVMDIRWLAAHRFPGGIVRKGERDL